MFPEEMNVDMPILEPPSRLDKARSSMPQISTLVTLKEGDLKKKKTLNYMSTGEVQIASAGSSAKGSRRNMLS